MKKLFTTFTGVGVVILTYFNLAFPASAQIEVNPCPNGSTGGTDFDVLCSLTANNIGSVISSVVTILLIAAALIALFFLIYGGLRWITSGGDKGKVDEARKTIIASIIGLIIALLAYFIITVVLGIFGLSLSNLQLPTIVSNSTGSQSHEDAPKLSVVAQDLDTPWALAFLPDQSMLVTERKGTVRFVDAAGNLRQNPIAIIGDVKEIGEGGLLGIAVDPKYEDNQFVYLYYTYNSVGNNTKNKVVRYTFDGNSLQNPKTLVDAIPGASNHDGGRIKFGPDGNLYITTGDSQEPSLAQNKSSLAGKILRVKDPSTSFGNVQDKSSGQVKAEVYSYGHRNPQGLAWDSEERLWSTEHGRSGAQSGLDELNLIESGKNYGWPEIEGNETRQGMVTPVRNSGASDTWAPSGAAFYPERGEDGSIFFAGLRGQGLYEAVLSGTSVTELKKHFNQELGRIREVVLGPDGFLYITTSNLDGRGVPKQNDDKILRVNPEKL